jgi:hypothetical protein
LILVLFVEMVLAGVLLCDGKLRCQCHSNLKFAHNPRILILQLPSSGEETVWIIVS